MKKLGILVLLLAIIALVGGSRLLRLDNARAIQPQKKRADLYLPSAIKLEQLATLLTDSLHVADDAKELKWAARLLGWQAFQPGHYLINHGFTYNGFLSKLAKGNQDPISLTVVPGQQEANIDSFLVQKMRFDSAAFHQVLTDSLFLANNKITPKNLIAHFFPATYEIYWTASPRKTLKLLFSEFNKQVVALYQQQAKKQDQTLAEVLTLASIIEGEALHDDEKPKISGLYWNRLKQNMPLQADPTVSYALKKQRRLYFKDYKVDDPYNTYLHTGLPPGPINNPSLSSIQAALNPQKHDFLYMVARPDGYHNFSKTYAEHQRKSAAWRQYLEEKAQDRSPADSL